MKTKLHRSAALFAIRNHRLHESDEHRYRIAFRSAAKSATGECFRELTADGHIIGSFTELEGTETNETRGGKVWFFKIKAEAAAAAPAPNLNQPKP